MGKWGVFTCESGYGIRSHDDGSLILHVGDNLDIGRQIVREHNAMPELVEFVKKWRYWVSMCCDDGTAYIDAVLSQVEHR